jgi:tRNA(Ile)-lysidine synthase
VVTDQEFAAAMAAFGPFEPSPHLAAGVSGGPDSMALAMLAHAWAHRRGGSLLALVVDHRLRAESGQEATETVERLSRLGIAARQLVLTGLAKGPGLAERARAARFAVLERACAEAGIVHLLLGHHAADQAETLMIRVLAGSGSAGLAGMAALVETARLRVLRPLLAISPARLRRTLAARDIGWVDDPSNADPYAQRARLRLLRGDAAGEGEGIAALVSAAAGAARERTAEDKRAAVALVEVTIRPEGFAVLPGTPLPPRALAALLQVLAGERYPPATASIAALAAAPRPATLAGVQLLPAGRLGPGLLAVREAAAMAPPVAAYPGAVWDGRFRLGFGADLPAGATVGAVGDDAARLRRMSALPSVVLRTLPAVRRGSTLLAVPHLHYPDPAGCARVPVFFAPPRPASAAPFRSGDA